MTAFPTPFNRGFKTAHVVGPYFGTYICWELFSFFLWASAVMDVALSCVQLHLHSQPGTNFILTTSPFWVVLGVRSRFGDDMSRCPLMAVRPMGPYGLLWAYTCMGHVGLLWMARMRNVEELNECSLHIYPYYLFLSLFNSWASTPFSLQSLQPQSQ